MAQPASTQVNSSATGTPGAESRLLRVCLMIDGRVIDEQRFDRQAALTIGNNPNNTFVIADPVAPQTHPLFCVHGGKYELTLDDEMRGQVAVVGKQNVLDIDALKSQGLLKKRGSLFALPLQDGHRGKISIGQATVVFQFVAPPSAESKMTLPADARPRLFQDYDKTFFLANIAFTLLAVCIVAFLRFQPQPAPITLENMDDRFVKMIMPGKKPEKKIVEAKKAPSEKQKPKEEVKKEEVAKAEPKPKDDEPRTKAQVERRANIRKTIANRGILAVLGTQGAGSASGAVADVFGEGKVSTELDSAFQGVSGVGLATGSNVHSTRGGGAGKEASIGGLSTSGGGKVGLGSKSEAKVAQVQTGEAEVDGSLDSGAVAKVVQMRMKMVQDCYERELKRDPTLKGKIEIEFTIGEDGRVEQARVSVNKMGSDPVGACIVSRIRTWRFPKPNGGSVTVNFPFIFAPSS